MGIQRGTDKLYLALLWAAFLLLSFLKVTAQAEIDYGLSFNSHETIKENRTSFNPGGRNGFLLGENSTLSFDFSFSRSNKTFGYIFRIVDDQGHNYDFLVNSFTQEKALLFIDGPDKADATFTKEEFDLRQWNHFQLRFNKEKNLIILSLNNKKQQISHPLKKIRKIKLYFGGNEHQTLSTTDVPPVNIKNLIFTSDRKQLLDIPFKFHEGNLTPDNATDNYLEVPNGKWLIDNHKYWRESPQRIIAGRNAQIAFDSETGRLFVADSGSVRSFDINGNERDVYRYLNGSILNSLSNQMLYDRYSKELVQYDLHNRRINSFNFNTRSWSTGHFSAQDEPSYWHHVSAFSPMDSALYTFGGYGFFTYKNTIFRYNFPTGKWDDFSFDGNATQHRYLSGGAFNKDGSKLYIFGGYGNASGKQELSPSHFYDLQVYNLKTGKISRLWEVKNKDGKNFVLAKSMIPDETGNSLFGLSFPNHRSNTYLQLLKINIQKPGYDVIGDSIPFQFDDTKSFADLFYSGPDKCLVAVISEKLNSGATEIQTYSIAFPAISTEFGSHTVRHKKSPALTIVLISLSAFLTIGFLFLKKRKKDAQSHISDIPEMNVESEQRLSVPPPSFSAEGDSLPQKPQAAFTALEEKTYLVSEVGKLQFPIQLIGGFNVSEKNGDRISEKMTPMMTQVFCLIYLSTIKNSKGITSNRIDQKLWPDKLEESAKNNRRVNIAKLRKALENTSIKIEQDNNYWKIIVNEEISSDYEYILNVIKDNTVEDDRLLKLIQMVDAGLLLPENESPWLDEFKSAFNYKLSDYLTKTLAEKIKENNDEMISRIFFTLERTDPLDEGILQKRCRYYIDKEHVLLARNIFQKFKADYHEMLGIEYPHSFNELLAGQK
jgi:DNA-binding SARP family transcriptional activator